MAQSTLTMEQQLAEKEREFHGKDDHLGLTLMTFPQYISATRSTMFTSHLKQFNVLNYGEFPKVFTNYENIFGQNSSSLNIADNDYEVVAKVEKFEDIPGHLYALFLYDEEHDMYEVVFKKISENLTEKYGYKINTENLDKLNIGDMIHKGDVIDKSVSFDEDNNYCYGLNGRIAYMLDPGNVEDAYIVSRSFSERCESRKSDTVEVSINDNDFLLNLYGTSKDYHGLPDIGEEVKTHILCAKRRIQNDQLLYDMKKANMATISPMSDKLYFAKGHVIDIDIYSNKRLDEIPDTEYNKQIRYYLKNQIRFYQELHDTCKELIDTGSKVSPDISFIYARARNILDPNYLWKDKETAFNNMIIHVKVDRDIKLFSGSKITGRYGDKGVISEIREDEDMPFTIDANGNKKIIDIIANPMSCPNRLNPFQWIEMSLTHDAEQLADQIKACKTQKEKYEKLMAFFVYFNERGQRDELEKYYNEVLDTKAKKDEFWKDVEDNQIFINYPPMWEGMPAIDKIDKLAKEFNFQRNDVYVRMHGRDIKIMRPITVGYKYMMKLKQDSEKNFSARSTGSLSTQGLPDKSNKIRTNEMLYSTTPIALGRDENNNLCIGVEPFMLAKMHLFYRTSPLARRKVGKLYTKDVLKFDKFKITPGLRNRNVEILNAKLKSLGVVIDFGFDGLRVGFDTNEIKSFEFKGKRYICTESEMREIALNDLMWKNFNKKKCKGTKKELEKKFETFKAREMQRAKGMLVVDINDI